MDVFYNRCYCRVCKRENRHIILFHLDKPYDEDEEISNFEEHFYVLECGGCESISFKNELTEKKVGTEDKDWEPAIFTHIYPPVLQDHKSVIDANSFQIPAVIAEIYSETLKAFEVESYVLAAAGFRAVIEATCKDLRIVNGDLGRKINRLFELGHISKRDANRLHAVRFLGNDSIHEIVTPEESQLYIVLEIVDYLLYSIYVIDEKVKSELESVISDFKEYKSVLNRKIKKFKQGNEVILKEVFGQTYRRLNTYADEYEKKLIAEIKTGVYKKLNLGEIKPYNNSKDLKQHFIVV